MSKFIFVLNVDVIGCEVFYAELDMESPVRGCGSRASWLLDMMLTDQHVHGEVVVVEEFGERGTHVPHTLQHATKQLLHRIFVRVCFADPVDYSNISPLTRTP